MRQNKESTPDLRTGRLQATFLIEKFSVLVCIGSLSFQALAKPCSMGNVSVVLFRKFVKLKFGFMRNHLTGACTLNLCELTELVQIH